MANRDKPPDFAEEPIENSLSHREVPCLEVCGPEREREREREVLPEGISNERGILSNDLGYLPIYQADCVKVVQRNTRKKISERESEYKKGRKRELAKGKLLIQ